ncbi:C39 family peptidase [Clostridium sp.]|uniref:C39 family peptidase n=1 Tax=Clostridium sp. TaxID=1506 RepID=UPI003216B549
MKKLFKLLILMISFVTLVFAMNICIYRGKLASALSISKSVLLDIAVVKQLPEYHNGCEATSLTMMLNHAGVKVEKATVVSMVKMDVTPIKYDSTGKIIEWGNPQIGFVGDITGKSPGYSIDPVALAPVINHYLPEKALDLTGCDYNVLESTILSGRPVVVWITVYFKNPTFSKNWTSNGKSVKADFSQHAVLLTGVDEEALYYNDPLIGVKNAKVNKDTFKLVWTKMGKKALSYYK